MWRAVYMEIKKVGTRVGGSLPLFDGKAWPQGLLPYMGYIGMCRCLAYGFRAAYSRIGYINQSVWV